MRRFYMVILLALSGCGGNGPGTTNGAAIMTKAEFKAKLEGVKHKEGYPKSYYSKDFFGTLGQPDTKSTLVAGRDYALTYVLSDGVLQLKVTEQALEDGETVHFDGWITQ